tara:strand:+ start:181401 stop:181595 length:195 start_codon:yes stop_codon:yes gene_type:complete
MSRRFVWEPLLPEVKLLAQLGYSAKMLADHFGKTEKAIKLMQDRHGISLREYRAKTTTKDTTNV